MTERLYLALADLQAAEAYAAAQPESAWRPMGDAPTDGTPVVGLVDGEPVVIEWAETRRCMLAGVGGGNGYFGPGWQDVYNRLIVGEGSQSVDGWVPLVPEGGDGDE